MAFYALKTIACVLPSVAYAFLGVFFEWRGLYLAILITLLPQRIFTLSAFQRWFLKFVVSFSGQGIFIFSV